MLLLLRSAGSLHSSDNSCTGVSLVPHFIFCKLIKRNWWVHCFG